MINDLISREYVKLFVCEYEKFNGKETEIVKAVPIIAIDNAPTVEGKLSDKQIEEIVDLLETNWGWEGIREEVTRILKGGAE